jgi:hypothetical protein
MRYYTLILVVTAVAMNVVLLAVVVHGQEQPRRPTAAELNLQLLNGDLANYRSAAAQLSEKNQQLQDQLDEMKKRCPEVSPQAVPK